jgi:hypothetical protein
MESLRFDLYSDLTSPALGISRALTELEQSTLQAAVFRVLPSSDGPGAREADVMAFIDWLTQQACFEPGWQSFVVGLRLLEATAGTRYGTSFHACAATAQDDLLAGLTTIPHPTVRRFFATLVRLAVFGFLSPLGYPGNRGNIGFHYMGYPGAPTAR